MKLTRVYMFVSIVFATLPLLCKTGSQLYNLDPQSVTVTEGRNVTLTCGSGYLTTCDSYKFSWKRKKDQDSPIEGISACSTVTRSFARRRPNSIAVELISDRYYLHMRNVQLEDTGTYWCYMNNAGHRISAKALLTVIQPLPQFKPNCDFEPVQPRVGATISFKCTLSERDPPSPLTWFESTSSNAIQIEDKTEVIPGETYTVSRELTEFDNIREFTCVAGPHLNGPNCSITPLQIPTTVSISPSHLTLHEHQNVTFTCDLKSTPQQLADRYEWRVFLVDEGEVKVQNLDGRFKLDQNG